MLIFASRHLSFSQTDKIGYTDIIANFVFPYICSFFFICTN